MQKEKISVGDFLRCVGQFGDDIPVTVKRGADVIGQARNLYGAPSVLPKEALSAAVGYVVVRRDSIVFQTQEPKSKR